MFRSKRSATAGIEFCESCSQVCTPACRARAHRERVQANLAPWTGPLR